MWEFGAGLVGGALACLSPTEICLPRAPGEPEAGSRGSHQEPAALPGLWRPR